MSYKSVTIEQSDIAKYVESNEFPTFTKILEGIANSKGPEDAILKLAVAIMGLPSSGTCPKTIAECDDSNYKDLKDIYESALHPMVTRTRGQAIANRAEAHTPGTGISTLQSLYYVLSDYCFPRIGEHLRASVRAFLNSRWDGIKTPSGEWQA